MSPELPPPIHSYTYMYNIDEGKGRYMRHHCLPEEVGHASLIVISFVIGHVTIIVRAVIIA